MQRKLEKCSIVALAVVAILGHVQSEDDYVQDVVRVKRIEVLNDDGDVLAILGNGADIASRIGIRSGSIESDIGKLVFLDEKSRAVVTVGGGAIGPKGPVTGCLHLSGTDGGVVTVAGTKGGALISMHSLLSKRNIYIGVDDSSTGIELGGGEGLKKARAVKIEVTDEANLRIRGGSGRSQIIPSKE